MGILVSLFLLVLATALVSVVVGILIRSRSLAVLLTLAIIESGVLFVVYDGIASSPDAAEVIGLPPFLAFIIAPVILLTAFFFVRSVERMRKEGQ